MALFQDVALAIFDMDGLLLDTERLGIRVALETASAGTPLRLVVVPPAVGAKPAAPVGERWRWTCTEERP